MEMVKRKNNSIIFAVLFVVVLLSISFASANIFTDLWNSFNGKIINVPSITGYATSSGAICPSPAVYGTSVGCVNLMAGSAAFVPPPNATRNDSYSCSQGYACYVCNLGYAWNGNKCIKFFYISNVNGVKPSYSPGETLQLVLNGKGLNLPTTPSEGFNVQFSITRLPLSDNSTSFGANADYDSNVDAWGGSLKLPSQDGSYRLEIFLYCSEDNAQCAQVYGRAAQVVKTYYFSINSSATPGCIAPMVNGTSVGCVNLMAGSAAFVPPPNATRNDSYSCSQGYACYVCNSGYVWNGNKCVKVSGSSSSCQSVTTIASSCTLYNGESVNPSEGIYNENFSIAYLDSSHVKVNYNGETSDTLQKGDSYTFNSGMIITIGEIVLATNVNQNSYIVFTVSPANPYVNACISSNLNPKLDGSCSLSSGQKTSGFSVVYLDSSNVKISYNGETSDTLQKGDSYTFNSGMIITIQSITSAAYVSGGVYVDFNYSINPNSVCNLGSANLQSGGTTTLSVGNLTYNVNVVYLDSNNVKFTVNGEVTDILQKGDFYKLNDGAYIYVNNILAQPDSGGVSDVEFSIVSEASCLVITGSNATVLYSNATNSCPSPGILAIINGSSYSSAGCISPGNNNVNGVSFIVNYTCQGWNSATVCHLCNLGYAWNGKTCVNYGNATNSCSSGCVSNGECLPIGYRQNGEYCAANGSFVPQLGSNAACENNFECGGNVCVNNQCVSQNIIQQILNWLAKLFG